MIWKISIVILLFCVGISSCGIYSLSGAKIEGKTIDLRFIENRANLVTPALSQVLTDKLRNRIINQTSLVQSTKNKVDYILSGQITNYDISTGAVSNDQAIKNRLNITIEIDFTNNLDNKASFKKTYNKFADYDATRSLQSVERELLDLICSDLADAVFSDAFVNW
jgi:Lipopolysaccharide-assembly